MFFCSKSFKVHCIIYPHIYSFFKKIRVTILTLIFHSNCLVCSDSVLNFEMPHILLLLLLFSFRKFKILIGTIIFEKKIRYLQSEIFL